MSILPSTAAAYFGSMHESYDSLIRRAVPRYDEMVDRLITYLPDRADRILELGCGTGNLTRRLLDRYPNAVLTSVDASPEMIDITRARTTTHAARLHLTCARFEDFQAAPASFDLVVSSLSLHHVIDKAALYGRIASWLPHGGTFAFADQLLGATPEVQARHWTLWLAFCREPGHCTEADIDSLTEHSRNHDHYVPLEQHFTMLTAAGFTNRDCTWRNGMYAVVLAQRA